MVAVDVGTDHFHAAGVDQGLDATLHAGVDHILCSCEDNTLWAVTGWIRLKYAAAITKFPGVKSKDQAVQHKIDIWKLQFQV